MLSSCLSRQLGHPPRISLWACSVVEGCSRQSRANLCRLPTMDKFVTRKRPAESSAAQTVKAKKVAASPPQVGSGVRSSDHDSIVPVENAVLDAVDATLSDTAQPAAERVTDASQGPAVATTQLQSASGARPGIVSAVTVATAPAMGPHLAELLEDNSWKPHLADEFQKPYFHKLEKFIRHEWATQQVFPATSMTFRAFNTCPFDDVKVVILGQDPYHNVDQAMGLSFSVPAGQPVPSSLKNMYKEIATDCGCTVPKHGSLVKWAKQGVLLLNVCLTVRAHQANSHAKQGWEQFTDAAIGALNRKKRNVVFLLWGKSAELKAKGVDRGRHHVLIAAHPSGLSANRGFFGCKHFSKTNTYLQDHNLAPIDWQIVNDSDTS